jgi:hypothetical protein
MKKSLAHTVYECKYHMSVTKIEHTIINWKIK